MSSLREQTLARVLVALTAALGGVSVSRSREISLTRANSPALVIVPQNNNISRMASAADRHQFELALEIFVRGDPWDSLADPVDLAAHGVLMTDATLWTLVSDVRRVSESFEGQEADRTAGTLTVHYQLVFLASAFDITRAA
jgi:hypothetical protein